MEPFDQSDISRELAAGERLLWTGRPRQGITFHAFDIFVIPFSIFWCSAVFFGFFTSQKEADSPFPFFFVPFFLMGFYMLVGRFLVDMWLRSRITYAVTNQRVIIAYQVLSRTVKSIQARNLSEVSLKERSTGGGTITLTNPGSMPWMQQQSAASWGGSVALNSLDLDSDARRVYELIRSLQSEPNSR